MEAAVEAWLKKKVANSAPRPDTVATYKNEIRHWFAWCQTNGIHPTDITRNNVAMYCDNSSTSGFAATTVRKKLSIISRFYESMVEDGYIQTNPANGVKPPQDLRVPTKKKHPIRPEMRRLLDAIPDDGSVETLRDRAIIALEIIEGWRRVDVHRANVEDIEAESPEGYRILVSGKTRGSYSYPESEVVSILSEYLAGRGQVEKDLQVINGNNVEVTPLFCALSKGGKNTRRLSRRGINYIIGRYIEPR